MQLRADPNALAPERLLVFEVTGSIQDFAKAVARIDGLEFAGEEELEADEFDANPELYLLVPQLGALREIVSLWDTWHRDGSLPRGFAPWRQLFLHLRSVRPWGPSDRVSARNREYFLLVVEDAPDDHLVRIELELVFRVDDGAALAAEELVKDHVALVGGEVIHSARRPEFSYHALLVDVPASEVRSIAELDPGSLAGSDPVATITPQSVGTPLETAEMAGARISRPTPTNDEPIAAVFDAAPAQSHQLLRGSLALDDPFDLESQSVGSRIHGTAMASIVIHGDLNDAASPISRKVYFRPVMYAPSLGDERFDDEKLLVDVIVEAVRRMRAGGGSEVIVVNLSLGDSTKPFAGKMSTWGRALDYLAFTYGILFLVSAGNISDGVAVPEFENGDAFLRAPFNLRSLGAFRGLDAAKADRRLLAPADSLNSLTIGSWHRDSSIAPFRGASPFMPYVDMDMPNLSSRLGPGLRRSTKPDALFAGGRQPVRLDPLSAAPVLVSHPHPSQHWGLKVAAPSSGTYHYTMGTSAATALATHSAHRIFDALEAAYPDVIEGTPLDERAALLKALLVHSAKWNGSETFIRSVVDPASTMHHEHWRREVCRHLGYGFVDPEDAIACAVDRATMWATGRIGLEGSLAFDVPIPAELGGSATVREIRATLAWFTPIRPGHLAYRAVKLRIPSLQRDDLETIGVSTSSAQPTNSQSESGTVTHRRWSDARIGQTDGTNTISIQIQREKDQGVPLDEAVPFGLAVTLEMPGAAQVYDQVLARIALRPRAYVRV
ncbi:S8 family peptidase [Tardiphaga sp. 37S4]|uniref:S8 family peptidase n=1 Tax=Tardiphaga sp. 37S4 TaxID=1404741 RepID=UPI001E57C27A|nr:S8 family peptidase [Tardiphaga sp. 37S4]UFS78578.1 S8 family peptidase [Tardiphaga sp. 37S4]